MSKDTAKPAADRKPPARAERKARGFLRAAELTPAALKTVGARRGFAELRLLTEWRAVVGEASSRACRPVKVTYGGRGPGLGATLVVTCEGARAPEVEARKVEIIDRVNAFYGYRAVSRLSIDQSRAFDASGGAAPGFGETDAIATTPSEAPDRPAGVKNDRLALALGRLGANVKAKAARVSAAESRSE